MQPTALGAYAAFCEWAPVTFMVVSENVFDPLIYYSHLVPILLSLPLALFVFIQAPKQRLNLYFFTTVLLFTVWAIGDLILWAHPDPRVIMFVWSLLILLEPLMYISAFLFAYDALFKQELPFRWLVVLSAALVPTIALLPTALAIESFNLTNCWREVTEGPLVYYGYAVQVLVAGGIFFGMLRYIFTTNDEGSSRTRSMLTALAVLFFLGVFSLGNIIGSYYEDWTIGQYGLFGMPIMVFFIGYLISEYKIFKSKIISSELLVCGLGIVSVSIVFLQSVALIKLFSVINLFLIITLGLLLVRSVRKEVEQRVEIEKLASRLQNANKRLKVLDQLKSEFVSIASHQLRSPLTSIRGYASMLLEGSFGKLPAKAQEAVTRINESSRYMAVSVEDYLNVSRIQSGNMKYELSEFDLKQTAKTIAEDLRAEGMKKGILISFRAKTDSKCVVKADIGKTRQIIQNLIDNALKYTKAGSIIVSVRDRKRPNRVFVDVTDTGIGMSKETLETIFGKFERARNANEVNVTGTGLGLFVAQKMAEDMGGTVTAHSDGEGKGSTFTLELPYVC